MELIVKILGGILTVLVVGYLIAKAKNTETNGKLYFGRFTLILSFFCFSFSSLMLWVWFFVDHGGQNIPISLLFLGFGSGFIYTFFEYLFTKGAYNENGISYKSPWSGNKGYLWEQLTYIDFNEILNWYVFEFEDGKKIRISSYMHGQKRLFEVLEQYDENNM